MKPILIIVCFLLLILLFNLPYLNILNAFNINCLIPAHSDKLHNIVNINTPRDVKIPDDSEIGYLYDIYKNYIDFPLDNSRPSKGTWNGSKLVVIDPGHGGTDPGSMAGTLLEKDIGLDVSLKLEALLKQSGIETCMTRKDDRALDVKKRIDIGNGKKAALFISIHSNWFQNPASKGTITICHPSTQLSAGNLNELDYALIVQNELMKNIETQNGGIDDRPDLAVLRHANMPSIIVELGFLSNPEDAQILSTERFRQKAAEGLASGILKALKRIG